MQKRIMQSISDQLKNIEIDGSKAGEIQHNVKKHERRLEKIQKRIDSELLLDKDKDLKAMNKCKGSQVAAARFEQKYMIQV